MGFLEWLQFSPPASFVAESLWAYPLFETLHTLGMALLIGSLGLIDLRLLGFKRELPVVGTLDLLPLAWLGFTVNLVSGLALFISDAVYFWGSVTFRIKLGLILLAGINAFLLGRTAFRAARAPASPGPAGPAGSAESAGSAVAPSSGVRILAASSLLFWIAAIVAGRLIAYLP